MEITVRRSQNSDRSWHNDLARRAWLVGYTHLYSAETINDFFDGLLPQGLSWDARRARRPADSFEAFAGLEPVGFLTTGPMVESGRVEVRSLYVAPDFQSQGVGRLLWSVMEEAMAVEGACEIEVWTLSEGGAVRFYQRMGCEIAALGSFSIGGHSEVACCLRKVIGPPDSAR